MAAIKTRRLAKPTHGTTTAGRTVEVPAGRYLELGRSQAGVALDVPDVGAVTVPVESAVSRKR